MMIFIHPSEAQGVKLNLLITDFSEFDDFYKTDEKNIELIFITTIQPVMFMKNLS